jgi:transcriptional regulator with XRE-family HTH domain
MKTKISFKEIAEKMGKSLPTIYRWKNGTCKMSIEDADKLEQITGVKAVAWMFPNRYKNPYAIKKEKKHDRTKN